ncbi:MAG: sigma-54 dependent transcriptional regulator, partial [Holophagales bacterium]|nr:sigma-54 dependent transcriptional regulator [Holophagales bacterium]
LSAYHDTEKVAEAMRRGATDCMDKPPSYAELRERIRAAAKGRRDALRLQLQRLPEARFSGEGPIIEQVLYQARSAARADLPVLILGETGTGKSLLARCIHRWSGNTGAPFQEVNVAALPSTVIDSELFGHEKGAFTGALRRRRGFFELAAGGTLFLDEIGDLPLESQVKLLGPLESGRMRRIGGERELTVSLRVLAATHQNLGKLIDSGAFREDLYYRLSGIEISLPALRHHPESIPSLARHFLGDRYQLTESALARLSRDPWPGNVRQLKRVLERIQVFTPSTTVDADIVEEALFSAYSSRPAPGAGAGLLELPYREASRGFRRAYVERLLERCGGNISRAARESGIHRGHLYEMLGKLGIDPRKSPGP